MASAPKQALLAGLFLLAAAWPLLVFADPPLQDYANHLARAFILLQPADPVLTRLYAVRWAPIPDLGWDGWALAVGSFLPLAWTGKLFLLVYLVLALGGVFVLNRLLADKPSLVPLLAVPFLFHGGYARGFLSFDLGMAALLWALAWWLWLGERRPLLRLAGATVFSTLLYLIHLNAFVAYGVFVAGLELPRLWRTRGGAAMLARDALQALPALVLFIMAMVRPAGSHAAIGYDAYWRRFLDLLLLIDTGHNWLNIIFLALVLGLAGWVIRHRSLRLAPRLWLPLALCLALFLASPDFIFGGSSVAWRFLVPAVLVGLAGLAPSAGEGRALRRLLGAAFTGAIVLSIAGAVQAAASEKEKAVFLDAIAPMPDGAKLFWAQVGLGRTALASRYGGTYHLGSFAVEAKRALVQSMFVIPGQQVLRFHDEALGDVPNASDPFLAAMEGNFRGAGLDFGAYLLNFDYVLLRGPGDARAEAALPGMRLRLVRQVGDCRLYAVRHD